MPANKYFCIVMVSLASLAYIIGGAIWYFDISDEPFNFLFILPAFVILSGVGIAFVGLRSISNHFQSRNRR